MLKLVPLLSPTTATKILENSKLMKIIEDIKSDKYTFAEQLSIVEAMHPAVRREIVQNIAGLDSSLLMTFKEQIFIVDSLLRSILNGEADEDEFGISLKDTLNLSTRLTQIMLKDLPKIYSLDRIQKQERALLKVMEKNFTREQQELFLIELEKIEHTHD